MLGNFDVELPGDGWGGILAVDPVYFFSHLVGSSLLSHFIASTSGGEIGAGTNESDYTSFTLAFPTIKFPGSYAFTVVMWNGISE